MNWRNDVKKCDLLTITVVYIPDENITEFQAKTEVEKFAESQFIIFEKFT